MSVSANMLPPDDIARVRGGAKIGGILPVIEAELDKMKETALTKAFMLHDKGTLTDSMAKGIILELYAYHRLLRRLKGEIRVSVTLGEQMAPSLEKGMNYGR